MKALIIQKPGSIDGLKLENNIDIPVPNSDEVRVEVKAVGLNPSDFQTIEFMKEISQEENTVLGLDVSGIVDSVGDDVTEFKKGVLLQSF